VHRATCRRELWEAKVLPRRSVLGAADILPPVDVLVVWAADCAEGGPSGRPDDWRATAFPLDGAVSREPAGASASLTPASSRSLSLSRSSCSTQTAMRRSSGSA
jgi:hypothetical protein